MAKKRKKPESVICPYCRVAALQPDITVDHVIARSWYPDGTPPTIRKWTVFACSRCNNEKSHIEQCMFVRIAACVDPGLPGAAGIWGRAKRSMDPSQASDPIEKAKRQRVRDAIVRDMMVIGSLPTEGALPSFLSNYHAGSRTAFPIDAHQLNCLVKLWALGAHQIIWGEAARADAKINIYHASDADIAVAFRKIGGQWKTMHGGPGVQIAVAPSAGDEKRLTLYSFSMWQQFHTNASIHENLAAQPNEGASDEQ